MRPGPPPAPRPPRRPLGPTPRYRSIPRWGLVDPIAPPVAGDEHTARKFASPGALRATLVAAGAVFALAAAVHVVRYLLLLINRSTLIPPFIAMGSLLSGVLMSLAAIVAVIVTAVVATSWLVARREAVFGLHGQGDPRPEWALWAGCVIPVVNLVWAPLFLIELAHAERCQARQRGPITMWWIAWVACCAICGWAIWTSRANDAQGIADNTVTVIIAYLAGLAVLLLLWRVFDGFVSKPVDRPLHRWVIVANGQQGLDSSPPKGDEPKAEPEDADESRSTAESQSESVVESKDREPAA